MQFNEFQAIIQKRATIDDENYYEVEKCWNEMAAVFSADITKTIQFLGVCTADEFSWLSEVFENIAEKTHSKEFVLTLRKTAEKFPVETRQYNILDFIEAADCIVESDGGEN